MTKRKWIAGAALTTLVSVASAGVAQAAEVEDVTLWDKDGSMGVKISQNELKAGKVTFDVANSADSSSQHEMIVAKLTSEEIANPDSLPYSEESATVDEEKINDRGEVSELDPGKSGSLTLDLKPGTYMLFCNVPGHYKAKMYSIIHVS